MTYEESPFDFTRLRVGADLRRLGIEPTRTGWHRIRRGVWLPREDWDGLTINQRDEAFIFATLLACDEPLEVTLAVHSAAALWGMPSVEPRQRRMHVLVPEGRSGNSRHVVRHHGEPVPRIRQRGALITPPARTVIDLARWGTLETALAAADFALRTQLCTRDDLETETAKVPVGARGRGHARLVVDLADGLSDSAGESVSRLQMFRANFPRPVLQRSYSDDQGLIGRVDFDHEGLIGEFDGKKKYRVPEGVSPEEAGEILWREKRREDRLRRFKPVARWVWVTALSTSALARLLISHGLRPEPKSTWIYLGPSTRTS